MRNGRLSILNPSCKSQCKPEADFGKPEPLKRALVGFWSRRINDEHPMVYTEKGDALLIAQLRYHY
jgi:toxin YoeB